MYIENQIPNQQKGEKLIVFLRRHWLIIWGHCAFYIFLALIPVLIYFFLTSQFPGILIEQTTYVFSFLLASLYYLFILLFAYHSFLDYHLDVWIVTNRRIINIEQKGLFNRMISEHELDKIQDVTGKQKGVLATFFTYGDVLIQTAGEVPMFVFRQVDNPFEVAKTINHLLKDIPPGHGHHRSDNTKNFIDKFDY